MSNKYTLKEFCFDTYWLCRRMEVRGHLYECESFEGRKISTQAPQLSEALVGREDHLGWRSFNSAPRPKHGLKPIQIPESTPTGRTRCPTSRGYLLLSAFPGQRISRPRLLQTFQMPRGAWSVSPLHPHSGQFRGWIGMVPVRAAKPQPHWHLLRTDEPPKLHREPRVSVDHRVTWQHYPKYS